jgi:hypothetical protein
MTTSRDDSKAQIIKCTPREFTPVSIGYGSMVLVPTEQLVIAIYNATPFMKDNEEKLILIENVWHNGDGVEVHVRRVPARKK